VFFSVKLFFSGRISSFVFLETSRIAPQHHGGSPVEMCNAYTTVSCTVHNVFNHVGNVA
jgi:hypothetical protein